MSSIGGKIGTQPVSTPYTYSSIANFTQPKTSSFGFRNLLGTIAGAVVNVATNVATGGAGGVISALISGKSPTASSPANMSSSVTADPGVGTGTPLEGVNVGTMTGDMERYLALQQQIQAQTRAYEVASSILKVQHDAAMAAIRNMR